MGKYLIDPAEYKRRELEPLGEVHTIADVEMPFFKMRLRIAPVRFKKYNPYFQCIKRVDGRTTIARLHFFDNRMSYYKTRYWPDWVIDRFDCDLIKRVLLESNFDFPKYNNWQIACWAWNMEYAAFNNNHESLFHKLSEYINGDFDNDPTFCNHPCYVPSSTKMPEYWVYDPPKIKKS